ncbi:MAG: hypothetical protein JST50_13365, partial [Bacteroidetes bacterium]|nr:hypothetical protein [Bacteroidota bacterium]
MILKRRPTTSWMTVMLGITMLSTSVFTSCQKDSSVIPASSKTTGLGDNGNTTGTSPTKTSGGTTGTTGATGSTGATGTTGKTGTTGTTGTTGKTGTSSSSTKFIYKASAPISLNNQSNITISGDSINVGNGGTIGIKLSNCNNV